MIVWEGGWGEFEGWIPDLPVRNNIVTPRHLFCLLFPHSLQNLRPSPTLILTKTLLPSLFANLRQTPMLTKESIIFSQGRALPCQSVCRFVGPLVQNIFELQAVLRYSPCPTVRNCCAVYLALFSFWSHATRLYMPLCPPVRRSVSWLVGLSCFTFGQRPRRG